jgi:transketolase
MLTQGQLDQLCTNTIRTLSIDAVHKARSGHPDTPMDAAPLVGHLELSDLLRSSHNTSGRARSRDRRGQGTIGALAQTILT